MLPRRKTTKPTDWQFTFKAPNLRQVPIHVLQGTPLKPEDVKNNIIFTDQDIEQIPFGTYKRRRATAQINQGFVFKEKFFPISLFPALHRYQRCYKSDLSYQIAGNHIRTDFIEAQQRDAHAQRPDTYLPRVSEYGIFSPEAKLPPLLNETPTATQLPTYQHPK